MKRYKIKYNFSGNIKVEYVDAVNERQASMIFYLTKPVVVDIMSIEEYKG